MADNVGLPLTGSGDTTATVATDEIGGAHYQRIKLFSGIADSTVGSAIVTTHPTTSDPGLVTRNIPSTSIPQLVSGGGSTTVDANLTSEGSTKVIGIVQGTPFSSANITRSTLNSSAEGQLFAANASRDYVMITNMSTAVNLFVGLTTGAVSTLGANAHFVIPPAQTFTLGGQLGNGPKYTGPIRCRLNSTTLVGPVIGVEFTT